MCLAANWRNISANSASSLTAGNNLVNSLGNSLSSSSSNGSIGSPSPLSSSFTQLNAHHQLTQHFSHQLNQFNTAHHAFANSQSNCPTLGSGSNSAFHQLNSSTINSNTDSPLVNLSSLPLASSLTSSTTNHNNSSATNNTTADSTLNGINLLNSDFISNSASSFSSLTPLQQQQLILNYSHHQQAVAAAHAFHSQHNLHSQTNLNLNNNQHSSLQNTNTTNNSSSSSNNLPSSSTNNNSSLSSTSSSNVDSKLQQLQQLGCSNSNVGTVSTQQLIECVVCNDKSSGKVKIF